MRETYAAAATLRILDTIKIQRRYGRFLRVYVACSHWTGQAQTRVPGLVRLHSAAD